MRGSLESATADSLALRTGNGQEMLSRAQIRRVQTRGNNHRKRNALIGLGIGTLGGLAVGAGIDETNNTSWFPSAGKAIFTPTGAIIGTVIGVALPSGGWREIYRAP